MASEKYPVTPAVRVLREQGVEFTHHLYEHEDKALSNDSRHLFSNELA
jgi:hypothetical protein